MIYRDNSDMQQGEDITKQKKTVASEKTILSADDITTHYDLDGLIPGKGDPRRPPEWLSRALLMVAISILIFTFVWDSWGKVSWIAVDLVICLFLSLAMEPAVQWLVRHGWRRPVAAIITWLTVLAAFSGLIWIFGQMFLMQLTGLVGNAPKLYSNLASFIDMHTSYRMPHIDDLGSILTRNIQTSWVTNFAGTALSSAESVGSFVMSLLLILFVTYYMMASGPAARRVICSWLKPDRQKRFLVVWTVVQGQVSSFLSSRVILAVISSICMSIYMLIMHVPYWLPLSILYSIISQFIPMVGAGIGAILPIIVAWSNQGTNSALFLLIYVVIYQQIENNLIAPLVQQRTMSVNAAVGLLSVFIFGAIFGFLGAFLALPVTASLQVIFDAYVKRQDLVDSPLLNDPKPAKKSPIVKAGEALNEKLTPLVPRAVRGSTHRVMSTQEQLREAARAFDNYIPTNKLDESATIAIPKQHKQDTIATQKERFEKLAQSSLPDTGDETKSKRTLWKEN